MKWQFELRSAPHGSRYHASVFTIVNYHMLYSRGLSLFSLKAEYKTRTTKTVKENGGLSSKYYKLTFFKLKVGVIL